MLYSISLAVIYLITFNSNSHALNAPNPISDITGQETCLSFKCLSANRLMSSPKPILSDPRSTTHIGPDNWPIIGTNIKLMVERPYGEDIPYDPTIHCLVSFQNRLNSERAARGDISIDYGRVFWQDGINVDILSHTRTELLLSKASDALRGIVQLMTRYPELGTKAVAVLMKEPGMLLATVYVTQSRNKADRKTGTSLNSTITSYIAMNVVAYVLCFPLASTRYPVDGYCSKLDPKNYRVPDTNIIVSLEGAPPYGSPLPRDDLMIALISGQTAADETVRREGDIALPGLWRFEEKSIGIDVYTQLSVDCTYSMLETGLLGLVLIMTEPGGVGAVAADFVFKEDRKGEVARGRLKLLRSYGAAGTAIAMSIEKSKTARVTSVGGTMESGRADTA